MNHLAKTIKQAERDAQQAVGVPAGQNLGWLVAIRGPGLESGMLMTLSANKLIGSAEACDLRVLNDPTVSRQHASIVPGSSYRQTQD